MPSIEFSQASKVELSPELIVLREELRHKQEKKRCRQRHELYACRTRFARQMMEALHTIENFFDV